VRRLLRDRTCPCTGAWRTGVFVELSDASVKPEPVGDVFLFTGNRHEAQDFLFKDELLSFVKDGTLSQLHTAFSRDQVATLRAAHAVAALSCPGSFAGC
jgi:hypothetical protein